jgi:hypothetical protein
VALAVAILFVAASAAPAGQATSGCAVVPAGSAPTLQVAAGRNRASLALYALGFSSSGTFAWLERRVGFDSDDHSWLLRVVDLDNDRTLVERAYATKAGSIGALCVRHGDVIAALLERYQIRYGVVPPLEHPEAARDPTAVDFVAGRRDPERQKTPHRVVLRGSGGTKEVGIAWQVEAGSGEPPLGKPALVGLMRSPYEPRVAVLCRQQMVATEGVELTMVTVFGGRLDRGWRATAVRGSKAFP